jgi:hypothetical protein
MAGFDDIGPILASLLNGVSENEHPTTIRWAQECSDLDRAQVLRDLAEFVDIDRATAACRKHHSHLEK